MENEMMKKNEEVFEKAARQAEKFAKQQAENAQRTTWYMDKFGWLHSTAEAAIEANQSYD